jgi:hypothetical protein
LVGGIGKAETSRILVTGLGTAVDVEISSDFEAAAVVATQPDAYYLGSCHTGAGAALGVLVPLLGAERCHAFGRSVPTADELSRLLEAGKVAFGFPVDNTAAVVSVFVDVLPGVPGKS